MAARISVPDPEPVEEIRQLAEAMADLHSVLGLIVENAKELVPGEAVEELQQAWKKSQTSMETLVADLTPKSGAQGMKRSKISHATLVKGELTGAVGKIKRSMLGRLKDGFLMFWNSDPRTDEKRTKAADAAGTYLEFGATVAGSIPGYEKVEELISLTKQLVGVHAKRGI